MRFARGWVNDSGKNSDSWSYNSLRRTWMSLLGALDFDEVLLSGQDSMVSIPVDRSLWQNSKDASDWNWKSVNNFLIVLKFFHDYFLIKKIITSLVCSSSLWSIISAIFVCKYSSASTLFSKANSSNLCFLIKNLHFCKICSCDGLDNLSCQKSSNLNFGW